MEKNQNVVEDGSMAGMPRLMQLRPRTNKYDEAAKGKLESYNFDQLTEEQEKEIEQKKQMKKYKDILDMDEVEAKEPSKEKIKLEEGIQTQD
jgi:hypothetical protein